MQFLRSHGQSASHWIVEYRGVAISPWEGRGCAMESYLVLADEKPGRNWMWTSWVTIGLMTPGQDCLTGFPVTV